MSLLRQWDLRSIREKTPLTAFRRSAAEVCNCKGTCKKSKVLLCDEPTGALDSKTAKEIMILLEEVNKKYGTTMLIVTHNTVIKDMVHRVIKIKDGMIYKNYINESLVPASELEW
jgi:ABC-type lipoprotein export system ATPase subunit